MTLAAVLLLAAIRLLSTAPKYDTETFLATAYSVGAITRSGEPVTEGVIAVDPRVIPLGSVVRIRGAGVYDGKYEALDTGRKIRGKRIDIFVDDYHEAVEFGARHVELAVVKMPAENQSGL